MQGLGALFVKKKGKRLTLALGALQILSVLVNLFFSFAFSFVCSKLGALAPARL